MAHLVASFNRLDRSKQLPSGLLKNHWYFTIINTESRFQITTDRTQILSLPTDAAQTDVIVPLLLGTFVKGLHRGSDILPDDVPPFAPFSWGTRSPDLARAIEVKLRALGVRLDLCTVQPGTKEQGEVADESWIKVMDLVTNTLGTALPQQASQGRCWFDEMFPVQQSILLLPECQRSDWKEHKKACGERSRTSNGQQSSSMSGQALEPSDYYHRVARTIPEAKVLADSINLPLPPRGGGLSKPIRRLVITGKDTTQNLRLLLGPNWQSASSTWSEARIEILLDAPIGSPSYAFHKRNDEGGLVSSPRSASVDETARIQTVREIQQAIRTRLGTRRQPTTQDMKAVLLTFGNNWGAMLPDYNLAVNTMDQGVPVRWGSGFDC
ncbi:uncharacterized protein LY89DRAFT_722756 [Mollisia scopiformis]|uniref:Uncharacterized protein n=1 Tax=Mollisia scopiformis TaxID=149040 RepID=A0A194WVF3_MOLSC|nr:uncharacterized protein LY89DRAFT_722756 [Mollisia scopiformis]KUJ11649.1 hypothetical protein LY89DRAFT_722756 [Mollisia scopiformis]